MCWDSVCMSNTLIRSIYISINGLGNIPLPLPTPPHVLINIPGKLLLEIIHELSCRWNVDVSTILFDKFISKPTCFYYVYALEYFYVFRSLWCICKYWMHTEINSWYNVPGECNKHVSSIYTSISVK